MMTATYRALIDTLFKANWTDKDNCIPGKEISYLDRNRLKDYRIDIERICWFDENHKKVRIGGKGLRETYYRFPRKVDKDGKPVGKVDLNGTYADELTNLHMKFADSFCGLFGVAINSTGVGKVLPSYYYSCCRIVTVSESRQNWAKAWARISVDPYWVKYLAPRVDPKECVTASYVRRYPPSQWEDELNATESSKNWTVAWERIQAESTWATFLVQKPDSEKSVKASFAVRYPDDWELKLTKIEEWKDKRSIIDLIEHMVKV